MRPFFQNLARVVVRVSLIFAISTSAFGNEIKTHSEHTESLGPHIHGKAQVHIVLDDSQLSVELHSPAMNLLGFEHGIGSAEDQTMVEVTRARLKNPTDLFFFNDGGCVLKHQSADFSDLLIANSSSHNDIKVSYAYLCEKPGRLHSVLIRLLDIFPHITSLQVQWIIHNRQGTEILNHENNKINF